MANQFIILLLFYNVLIIGFVAAFHGNRIDFPDFSRESNMPLIQPIINVNGMDIDPNNLINRNHQDQLEPELENWTGKWMPENDPEPTTVASINSEFDDVRIHHSVPMGSSFPNCDNGKSKLSVDWDNSPVNYTCYGGRITPSYTIPALKYCERIPRFYKAIHRCMNHTIEYDADIPLYGTHRPVWPTYGEYKFLPRQRWLHSLEHGAVVMLYHPCANPLEVRLLKDLVTKCLRRHIITRYNLLDIERPLALVTWGCRLTMSYVDKDLVTSFIHDKALRGPETIIVDGEFTEGLLTPAKIVSDKADSQLCPSLE